MHFFSDSAELRSAAGFATTVSFNTSSNIFNAQRFVASTLYRQRESSFAGIDIVLLVDGVRSD